MTTMIVSMGGDGIVHTDASEHPEPRPIPGAATKPERRSGGALVPRLCSVRVAIPLSHPIPPFWPLSPTPGGGTPITTCAGYLPAPLVRSRWEGPRR